MSDTLELRGCAPEPLMAYLKALGIFRLAASQRDPDARAWWNSDTFLLKSKLDRDSLVEFFLKRYRPTPIVSPWNNRFRTGVAKGDKAGLDVIRASAEERLSAYRCHIEKSKTILEQEEDKGRILAKCRTQFSDEALGWLDAVYVLTAGKPAYPPLTSNGGTLGTSSSGDISMNFAKNLVEALSLGQSRRRNAATPRDWLSASLFGDGSPKLSPSAGGQFSPGGWGPNSTIGFEADSLINPWDFLFLVEGTVLFAGAPVRRLTPESRSKAVFPFTVDASAAGYSTTSSSEYASARAEFWAPLWGRPSTLGELRHIASEGRSQLGRHQASTGTSFARGIAGLGIERGIDSFQRFGFLQRTGRDAVFAAPIGRFAVNPQPNAGVLFDLDTWMQRLLTLARGNYAPAGVGTALRQVEGEIIEFCQRGRPQDLQNVLIAVGRAERWVASSGLREDIGPLPSLSSEWLDHANDGSVEFRLAKAMSSILQDPAQGIGPIRWNLEAVGKARRRLEWVTDSTSFVWTGGDQLVNMLAVLERRCLEGRMHGMESDHPPLNAMYSAQLRDIVSFLHGYVDDQRLIDLSLPLSFVHYWNRPEPIDFQQVPPFDLPAAYAAMKLTLLPDEFKCLGFGPAVDIALEPSMLAMLRAGRVGSAYQVACRRLRASGLRPLSEDPGIRDGSEQGTRLAAALLFPLDKSAHCALAQRALRKPDGRETESMAQ